MGGLAGGMTGLARGLNTGLRIAAFQEDRDLRRQQMQRQQEQDKLAVQRHQSYMQDAELRRREAQLRIGDLESQAGQRQTLNALAVLEEMSHLDQDDAPVNVQRGLDAIGGLMSDLVDDDPRRDGSRHRVSQVVPTDEGLAFELEVDEGGKKRRAPLTVNRSSDPQDAAFVLPPSVVFAQAERWREKLQASGIDVSNPHEVRAVTNVLRASMGDMSAKEARDEAKRVQAVHDREMEQLREKLSIENEMKVELEKALAPYGGGGGKDGRTAKQKEIDEFMLEYQWPDSSQPEGWRPPTYNEAYEYVTAGKHNPRAFVEKYVLHQMQLQEEEIMSPGNPGYLTMEQLAKKGAKLAEKIDIAVRGGEEPEDDGTGTDGIPGVQGDTIDPDAYMEGIGVFGREG